MDSCPMTLDDLEHFHGIKGFDSEECRTNRQASGYPDAEGCRVEHGNNGRYTVIKANFQPGKNAPAISHNALMRQDRSLREARGT